MFAYAGALDFVSDLLGRTTVDTPMRSALATGRAIACQTAAAGVDGLFWLGLLATLAGAVLAGVLAPMRRPA
ncbi:MAG: hypothetical protein AAGB00_13465 [Planctomycetota bacterium]